MEAGSTQWIGLVGQLVMIETLNYRKVFLEAISLYLEGTPQTVARARNIIASLGRPAPYTISDVLWGPYIGMLGGAEYFENRSELQRLARQLRNSDGFVRRVYLKFDFRPVMGPSELQWFNSLWQTAQFLMNALQLFGKDMREGNRNLVAEYERLRSNIRTVAKSIHLPKLEEENTVYEVIMQQSSAVLSDLDVKGIGSSARGLIPHGTYSVIASHQRLPVVPDAAGSLRAVAKALEALTGSEWLLLTVHASGHSTVVGVF
ncbi:MAG TPA: hypothetical protein VF116_04465 [Ktedonobacterales bacterium]